MRTAFSLVELSIVLVILGLLTGGILTGQNLIRAAELRSVTTELKNYQTAAMTFRDKYFYLPGDMPNATDFWGAAHSTPATCRTTASTDASTCNGNGDGQISTVDSGTTYSERFRVWQHLANAGLIEGTYSGVAGSGGVAHAVIGTNIPRSKLNNGGFSFFYLGAYADSDTNWFPGNYQNSMLFGAGTSTTTNWTAIISPEEMWNIDTKLDDGKPGTGKVRVPEFKTACHDNSDPAVSQYKLDDTSIACPAVFMVQ